MQVRAHILAGFIGVAATCADADILGNPNETGALMSEICVPNSLDFDVVFSTASDAVKAAGLAAIMDDDKAKMFGNPAQSHLVLSRTIDSFACALTIRAPEGSQDYFLALQAQMETSINAVYPNALSVSRDLPSPHEEEHQWVYSVPKDRHYAVSLRWQVEDGVLLAIGYRQIYE